MPECINCNAQLSTIENELGSYEHCSECNSILIDHHDLRNSSIKKKFLSDTLTASARNKKIGANVSEKIICPNCNEKMSIITDMVTSAEMHVCPDCEKFWFAQKEMKLFPQKEIVANPVIQSQRTSIYGTPEKAKESEKALDKAIYGNENRNGFSNVGEITPCSNAWEAVAGLLGLHVIDNDGNMTEKFPIISFTLAIFFFCVWGLTKYDLNNAVAGLAFTPNIWYANFGLKAITSLGLHTHFIHFLFNAYYLVTLGSFLENTLGRVKFVMLILGSQVVGLALHTLFFPQDTSILLGASAGIGGLFSYFVVMNPNQRISIIIHYLYIFRKISLNAWIFLIVWIFAQLSLAVSCRFMEMRILSITSVLGGLLCGLVIGLIVRVLSLIRAEK